ncbi:UNVERIFIED_CONTAM: hypothetical protein FKN15_025082 [Acipenser sinensis]
MSAVTDPAPDSPGSDPARKRRAHGMLKLYYGINEEGKPGEKCDPLDPCDINGARFEPEVYLNKDSSLAELMDQETGMVKQIRSLDSDMQTLVYENYNKFISATDTIRKMKNDFKKMEDEMDCLAANMAAITEFSTRISGTLQGQHQQITKLTDLSVLYNASLCFTLDSMKLREFILYRGSSRLQDGELASRDVPRMASSKLVEFVDRLCGRYFSVVELRIREETGVGDNSLLVRALDRFHRRLQAVSKVLPGSGVPARGTEIVVGAARGRVRQYLAGLKSFYLDSLTDVRQALSAPRLPGKEAPSLAEVLGGLSSAVLTQVKSVLAYVRLFTAKDVSFASKAYFKGVREGLVVGFIQFICQSSQQFCESVGEKGAPSTPPSLLLLLSRLCLDYESSTISYILTLADEQFLGQDQSLLTPVSVLCAQAREDQPPLTPVSVLCAQAREVSQRLLNHYVKLQGLIVSQMLRKSVETRDWINTIEPRNVRAVMKRVVEDTTAIDVQVGGGAGGGAGGGWVSGSSLILFVF